MPEVICSELCDDSGVYGSDIKQSLTHVPERGHLGCLSQQTFKINLTLLNMNIAENYKRIRKPHMLKTSCYFCKVSLVVLVDQRGGTQEADEQEATL